jgi:uncharacterized protein YprB with RNaseH-like and TPR domain
VGGRKTRLTTIRPDQAGLKCLTLQIVAQILTISQRMNVTDTLSHMGVVAYSSTNKSQTILLLSDHNNYDQYAPILLNFSWSGIVGVSDMDR